MGLFRHATDRGAAKILRKAKMGGEEGGEPQHAKPEDDIKVLVDPALRLPVVEAVNIINVDGEIGVGQMGARRRSKKAADQHQPRGQAGPGGQSPFVITQATQEPKEQQGQTAMKKRKPAGEKRQPRVEHVTGQAKKAKPQHVGAEVREPEALWKQNADGTHADKQGALPPHACHRKNKGGIAEP